LISQEQYEELNSETDVLKNAELKAKDREIAKMTRQLKLKSFAKTSGDEGTWLEDVVWGVTIFGRGVGRGIKTFIQWVSAR